MKIVHMEYTADDREFIRLDQSALRARLRAPGEARTVMQSSRETVRQIIARIRTSILANRADALKTALRAIERNKLAHHAAARVAHAQRLHLV